MTREERQSKILEIIKNQEIDTQEGLLNELKHSGLVVTQATISRDIKEMGILKVLSENGGYKYDVLKIDNTKISERLMNLFKESVLSVDYANNIIVVKTLGGSANAAANAIDSMPIDDILGSIAGDDTIMIVMRTEEKAKETCEKFIKIIKRDKKYD